MARDYSSVLHDHKSRPRLRRRRNTCGQGRDRTGDLPLFRRTLVPTELPGPDGTDAFPLLACATCVAAVATLTGLEPATSAVTGRRANQLRHRALLVHLPSLAREAGTPY